MSRIKQAKPSPALIVAVVALVAALAGTAVGGVAVTSLKPVDKKIVKRVAKQQGKRQAKKQIKKKEPTLNVNSAKSADVATSATNAQNADAANGVRPVKVDFAAPNPTSSTTLLDEGGLKVSASCAGIFASIALESTAPNGSIIRSSGSSGLTGSVADNDFDPGDADNFGTSNSLQNLITYRGASGTTVTGELLIQEDAAAADCVVAGTLFVG
jgi:hypothetical protein